jgi:hypothetical protein
VFVALGARQWDVTHRAVVIGLVDGDDPEAEAARHLADGADLLGLAPGVEVVTALAVVDPNGPELTALGDLVLPAPARSEDRETVLARQSLAITRGARVVLTRDVRGTRRVADVLAAILART